MLLPTICILLIVLVCTITVSYHLNKEAFADMDAPLDPRVESNTDSKTKKERINVRADYNGKEKNYMRVFASMPSLSGADQRTFWVIGHDKVAGVSVVEGNLIVTKDPNYVSANIPVEDVKPWFGKILYIVPNGIQSTADAYASFIVPTPKNSITPAPAPAPVPAPAPAPAPAQAPAPTPAPTVELSDAGYKAMELNKQSNLLNDIQKIVKNEILADRMLDVTIKNTVEKPKPKKKSCDPCDNSQNGSCDDVSNDSSAPKIDMSQYIKKDEIPCWGCSIDY
jgi:hypothetical protein